MDPFPLQDALIDAVIGFVNDTLQSPDDVKKHFRNEWTPESLPRLKECRSLQTEVRGWLLDARQGLTGHVLAVHGLGSTGYPSRSDVTRPSEPTAGLPGLSTGWPGLFEGSSDEDELDNGIRMTGQISLTPKSGDNAFDYQIVWDWKISKASLRAICGLAVASICEANLAGKIWECARDECTNVFIDSQSRGIAREYCHSKKCADERNNAAVKKSRKNPAKKGKSRKRGRRSKRATP